MWMLGSLMTSRWQSLSSATSSISPAPAQPAVTCPMAQRRYAFVGGGFDVVFLELLPEQPYYPQAGWSPSRFVFTLLPCLRNDQGSQRRRRPVLRPAPASSAIFADLRITNLRWLTRPCLLCS